MENSNFSHLDFVHGGNLWICLSSDYNSGTVWKFKDFTLIRKYDDVCAINWNMWELQYLGAKFGFAYCYHPELTMKEFLKFEKEPVVKLYLEEIKKNIRKYCFYNKEIGECNFLPVLPQG